MLRIFLLACLPWLTQAQTNLQQLVDNLRFVKDMPYICDGGSGCGDSHFWEVVKQKQAIIPFLLEKLSDTTQTEVFVPNFGGLYTVGDVAYTALEEIVHGIPTFKLLGRKFDTHGCGYCVYWSHLRKNPQNRLRFQRKVRKWYEQHKANLVWVNSNEFSTCDCFGQHPNSGHFELKN